jgi:hypothetical protein
MRKLRIGVVDLVSKCPTRTLWARVMHANFASIMPQAVAVWCQEEGHDVTYLCYTGSENLAEELPHNVDLVFIGAFTEAAQSAYALSNQFRSRGAVTVLGGPHARCYPQDAQKYFDYVLGFTDKSIIHEVLTDCAPNRPMGAHLSAAGQPSSLPGVRERWAFINQTLKKAPLIKMVPMLGSLGCPYHCSFCIDSVVPYQPLDLGVMKEDLTFLLTKFKRPLVAFHDPNFGVQFDNYMDAIEEAVPPGRIEFAAESSLSLLSEPHLIRLKRNGFKALLPGIESWYELGEKSRTGKLRGMDKVLEVSDHINMILRYIPYLQANFVLGLDVDAGDEPFELTKRFIDLAPGAFPGYSLISAFGQAAPLNLQYQQAGRVIPFPFHFLNNNGAMNIGPMNYSWPEFYKYVIDLTRYSFSPRSIYKRARATKTMIPKWLNVIRAISSEGYGRIDYYSEILRRLHVDPQFRPFFERETSVIPQFYVDRVQNDLGPMWHWLPDGALQHDPNAYLTSTREHTAEPVEVRLAV